MSRDRDSGILGLQVLHSCLSHRRKKRKAQISSPDRDEIRPTRWTQANELLLLLSMIEHTFEVTPQPPNVSTRPSTAP